MIFFVSAFYSHHFNFLVWVLLQRKVFIPDISSLPLVISGTPFSYDITAVSNSKSWHMSYTSGFLVTKSQNILGGI